MYVLPHICCGFLRGQDFDSLLDAMKGSLAEDSRSAFVFNCSNGKGRTTTAMVLSVLTLWHFNVRCAALAFPARHGYESGPK